MAKLVLQSRKYRAIVPEEMLNRREKAGLSQAELATKIAKILNRDSLSDVVICQLENYPVDENLSDEDEEKYPEISTKMALALEKALGI